MIVFLSSRDSVDFHCDLFKESLHAFSSEYVLAQVDFAFSNLLHIEFKHRYHTIEAKRQVYMYVHAAIKMLLVALCYPDGNRLQMISAGLMGHLTRMQNLPFCELLTLFY